MIKGRKLDHIGLASCKPAEDAQWYHDVLGFEEAGKFAQNGGYVYFMQNGTTVYEIYNDPAASGKIDHIAYVSEDIEADYNYCKEQGYQFTTPGIMTIEDFWEHGIQYFKIASPGGEEIEFITKIKA